MQWLTVSAAPTDCSRTSRVAVARWNVPQQKRLHSKHDRKKQIMAHQIAPQTGTSNWQEFAKYRSRILHRESVARNVHSYVLEKPHGFTFTPGQAIGMAIDEQEWRDQNRPFSITSLPSNPRLELIIKSYPVASNPNHDGMTEHLGRDMKVGDRVIFGDAWGAIRYSGPGVFIAGGAGITPFLSILRDLEHSEKVGGNRLFASNRTAEEVIMKGELARILGRNAVFTLTDEKHRDYEHGQIDRHWLESRVDDFNQYFYVCGPPKMVEEMTEIFLSLGASRESIIVEQS